MLKRLQTGFKRLPDEAKRMFIAECESTLEDGDE
jgi:hypothetical protein